MNFVSQLARDDGKQYIQEIVMHLFGFVHGGTSMNQYTRSSALVPFSSTLILF